MGYLSKGTTIESRESMIGYNWFIIKVTNELENGKAKACLWDVANQYVTYGYCLQLVSMAIY